MPIDHRFTLNLRLAAFILQIRNVHSSSSLVVEVVIRLNANRST
jgi:hypothetical protein